MERKREERMEAERRVLVANRKTSLGELYAQIIESVLQLPSEFLEKTPYVPSVEDVWNLPWVQALVDQKNDDLSDEEWRDALAPKLRLFTLDRWRNFLRSLVGALDRDSVTSLSSYTLFFPEEGRTGSWMYPEDGPEKIREDIGALKNRLSLPASAFQCNCGLFDTVMWFPDVLRHGLSYHDWTYPQQFLRHLAPFDRQARSLVRSLLRSSRLDQRTIKTEELMEGKNWLCLRCDPQVARYRSFKEIVSAIHIARVEVLISYVLCVCGIG